MHSPIFHDPSWDQSKNCSKAQGTLCRGSTLRGNGWIGLQAEGCHRLSVGTGHRGSIPVPTIKLKGDTPFPPTLLSYTAGIILWLDKAVGEVSHSGWEASSVCRKDQWRLCAPNSESRHWDLPGML